MPFLIEHVTDTVLALIALALLGTASFVVLAIARRRRREKYFRTLDEMRERFGPLLGETLNHQVDYESGLDALKKGITGIDRIRLLERLLLERIPAPDQVPTLRRLCVDLGLVTIWQQRLGGKPVGKVLRQAPPRPESALQKGGWAAYTTRAESAEYLGRLKHGGSWPQLVKTLNDPHPDVQSVSARALASIGEPKSFPPLVERFHQIVIHPSGNMSLRTIKSALASFPISQCIDLLPGLVHSHPRIRSLTVDVIREMIEREEMSSESLALDVRAFPAEVANLFLTKLCVDQDAAVRARSAPVIASLPGSEAIRALLVLLEDGEWFVRLQAVRALAKHRFRGQSEQIVALLIDSHWMVREAAARALLSIGPAGVRRIEECFLQTRDGYSREQIADEMQRTGFITDLLARYEVESDPREKLVLERLASLGKTSYVISVLRSSADLTLRRKFLADFGSSVDSQIRSWVRHLAEREPDNALREMAMAMAQARP